SLRGLPPSGSVQAVPGSFSFSRAYSRTSQNSAPSRRIRRTSSTRACTVAFVAFMSGHQVENPGLVPVVQPGVVDQGKLLPAAALAAEVGRALDRQPRPGGERQRDHLGVAVAAGGPLPPAAELPQRLPPQPALVGPEEQAGYQAERADGPGVEPAEHRRQV